MYSFHFIKFFCSSFLFLSSLAVFPCYLMTIIIVIFRFLSFFWVYIINFLFVVAVRFIDSNLSIYVYISVYLYLDLYNYFKLLIS